MTCSRMLVLIAAAVLCMASVGVSAGATWDVYPSGSIQDAIDSAGVGDTIYVHAGTYIENVDVDKRITLIGDGADVVTVRAASSHFHVFEVTEDYINISGFTVTGATNYPKAGIYLGSSVDHCNILDNTVSNNYHGIYLYDSCNNNTVAKNNASSNKDYGIYLYDSCNNNTLMDNSCSNNYHGISLFSSSNNNTLMDNNCLSNNWYGIGVYGSSNNTLTENTISNNKNGINLRSSSSNTLNKNNCSNNNVDGIELDDSSNNNTLTGNTANSNEYCGIHLYSYKSPSTKYNTLTGNTANLNGEYGIHLDASVGNVVVNNTANSNRDGIHIDYVSSINNTIHHNSFADNTRYDAYDACHDSDYYRRTNTWDDGTEGNYYSDYTGTDADGNGIGDTPYSIPRSDSNVDNYPLMQAWNGYQVRNSETGKDFLGIQVAIDDSDTDDGHTVIVGAGVYRLNVNVNKRIALQGTGSGLVTVIAGQSDDHVFDVTANYVNISGFTVTGAGSGKGIYLNGTDHCSISNNIVSNNEYGICLNSSRSSTLANNAISGNTYNFVLRAGSPFEYTHNIDTSNTVDGKSVYYWVDQRDKIIPGNAGYVGVVNSTNITVRDLTLTRNGGGVLFAYTEQSVIENVTVNSNKDYGIYLYSSSSNTLTNTNASSNGDYGICMDSSSSNTLTNTNASSNGDYGICMDSSSSNTLTGNTANSNHYGIYLNSSSNNILTNTNASSNEDYGVHLLDSGNSILQDITVNWNRCGIYLNSSNDSALRNNSVSNNSYGINLYSSSNNTLSGNAICLSDQCGITLDESSNNTLSGNAIRLSDQCGITLDESSNNTLANNTANSNGDYGLYMSSSSSNTITGNTMSSNNCGIYLDFSSHNTVAKNNASSNKDYGIYLHHSSNNKLTENTANWNSGDVGYHGHSDCDWNHCYAGDGGNGYGYGIMLSSSSNNMLTGNTANSNGGRGGNGGGGGSGWCRYGGDGGNGYGYGILLSSSSNNTLTGNSANLNWGKGGAGGTGGDSNGNAGGDYGYGILLSSSSSDNTLYHNNLADNKLNDARDTDTNQWDSGSEGNYYSEYTGTDLDGDGIGDTPFNISGGAGVQDRYPLMQPWNEGGSEFISIGSVNAPTNSTITIPVSVANVTNISGISFDLLYNSSVVTVSSVSANESFTGSSITPNIDNITGTTSIVLTNSNLISTSTETPVIDIAFNITGGSGSSTTLDLQNVEFSDANSNPYTPAVVVDGQITVGIKGDFNGNGRVDIGDAAKVAFMVAGKVTEDLNADFNGNGRVDIGDAAKIAFYLAGKVNEL